MSASDNNPKSRRRLDIRSLLKNMELWKKVAVVIAIIIAFAIMIQWSENSTYFHTKAPYNWVSALMLTLEISIVSILMGFTIGIVMGLGRLSHNFLINGISTVYIEIFRGTPLLVQIFIIYFGLPELGYHFDDPWIAASLALGLNSGAYQAEIIRGGIQSIPRGQMEAARSSGMSYLQAMRHVILPQGLRLIIPPMTNEYVTVIKDSSLAYAIGAVELTKLSYTIASATFDPLPVFLFVALMYFTLTFSTSTIMRFVENKYRIPGYMGV